MLSDNIILSAMDITGMLSDNIWRDYFYFHLNNFSYSLYGGDILVGPAGGVPVVKAALIVGVPVGGGEVHRHSEVHLRATTYVVKERRHYLYQAGLWIRIDSTWIRIWIQNFSSIRIRIHKIFESGSNADPVPQRKI
jgi:hypothetical protein